ncbi:hypothetical protein [Streptomyces sp. NPDC058247]|uniref:hypothetical protein n=1 Tax=Streptomyces sp. NPDC058247 TaxID=3346401 RepID=UPI0036EBAD85
MRTGPLVDALIEHLVGDLGSYALENSFHVVVEGVLYADRYGTMLQDLVRAHRGVSRCYYLCVPYTKTLLRHATVACCEALCLPSDRPAGRPTGPAWRTARGMMGME